MENATQDAELLDRLRRRDAAAFDEVVRLHRRSVYMVARRMLGSHQDADEAAQQAFIRAWRAVDGFRGQASLRTWLIRIVLNVAKSMRASRREMDGLEDWDRLPDPAESTAARLARQEVRERIRRVVAELPARQQQVVVMKVFSEMTYREVAEAMELSEGTVKAHLNQAVSNLRKKLAAAREKGDPWTV